MSREPIPGEHEHGTEPPTQPSIVGGTGVDLPPSDLSQTMDEETKRERVKEGGGDPEARRRRP